MARASAVAPSVSHKAAVDSPGSTTIAMSIDRAGRCTAPSSGAGRVVRVLPTSQMLAITIGTATKANVFRDRPHAHMELVDEVHGVDAEEPENR